MFTPNIKMAELVEQDYTLLPVIARMGIEGSFGEKTVREICELNGLDPDTFLLLCDVCSQDNHAPQEDVLRRARLSDVLRYLHQSHDYYVNNALVSLAASLEKLLEPCSKQQQTVIWKFFSDYKKELENHFEFEEGTVIPYVNRLLMGEKQIGFGIDNIEDNHSNIEETLSDLKNIIMKSLPAECNNRLKYNLLLFIYNLQKDLDRHTRIEDDVMVPMVHLVENPRASAVKGASGRAEAEKADDALSEREKEILVSVAKGLLNKEIADKHNISINTVITHRKNITRKTGIKTVAGLTVYAILNGLIDISTIE